MRFSVSRVLMAVTAFGLALPAVAQTYTPPPHVSGYPGLGSGTTQREVEASLTLGPELERNRPARWMLADRRRMDRALAALQPQRKGIVDTYVISIGLDSDPVFGREARQAGKVLSSRYTATGRTIVMAGTNGSAPSELPNGSITNMTLALARIAELMDPKEDVLVLYTTSHGAPIGIVYNDADQGFGMISPQRLWAMLGKLGIERRMVLISACYSGVFVPLLASEDSVVITASSADRTSFGCQADNDWTFFGDALINHALRKAQPIDAAGTEAVGLIGAWEAQGKLTPSQPQVSIGSRTGVWLAALDARGLKATSMPVGRPAVSMLDGK